MSVRYLGFMLLVWLPGQAQEVVKSPCKSPVLSDGYFVPEQDTYPHEATLTYACDTGHKPVVEGWWATITCQNGKWSHDPQCIDKNSCIPPTIPNGGYQKSQNSWYENGQRTEVTCNAGYELTRGTSRIRCNNGEWSPLRECRKSSSSCNEPPRIPHAVIINHRGQEVYEENTKLSYECEDGFVTDNTNAQKSITCRGGTWTEAASCNPACVMDPNKYYNSADLPLIYLNEGETKMLQCRYSWKNFWTFVRCTNRRVEISDWICRESGNCRTSSSMGAPAK